MRKWVLCLLMLVLVAILHATVLTVSLSGASQYSTIQSAIDNTATGDTVLVYPGLYHENVVINAKSITLTSLYLLTPVDSLRYQTIIDGNKTGNGLYILSSTNTIVKGFTIQNGYANRFSLGLLGCGGGLFISSSTAQVIDCIIKQNFAPEYGGGIALTTSTVFLSGNSMYLNHADQIAGGLYISRDCIANFDNTNLNSIYDNYAAMAMDIARTPIDSSYIAVPLDTVTVGTLNEEYIRFTSNAEITCQHSFLELVAADMYVNPVTGDDRNSGLSWSEPLKTVAKASQKILPDSTQTRTIYLAPGIYSRSTNGEYFPIHLKENLRFQGAGMYQTIWDGEQQSGFLWNESQSYVFQKLSIDGIGFKRTRSVDGAVGAVLLMNISKILISNVHFYEIACERVGYSLLCRGDTLELTNAIIEHNQGGVPADFTDFKKITIKNLISRYNTPFPENPEASLAAIQIGVWYKTQCTDVLMENCLFESNLSQPNGFGRMVGTLNLGDLRSAKLVNCTFINNQAVDHCNISICRTAAFFYNCIFYNFSPSEFRLWSQSAYPDSPARATFRNCLVRNGVYSFTITGETFLDYDDSNISGNPQLFASGDYQFRPMLGSPCVDTGTMDIPEYTFPLLDLGGSPRVIGAGIDMGCYEQDPSLGTEGETASAVRVSVYPNPSREAVRFTGTANVGQLKLAIYNLKGQLVYSQEGSMKASGPYELYWNGENQQKQAVAAGVYLYRLQSGDKTFSGKMIRM